MRASKGNVTYIGESVTSGPFAGSEYSYNGAGYLSAIDHNNFRYSFNYDVFGKLISTAIANTAVSTNTYDNSGRLTKTLYANGDYFEYTYDSYDNVLTVTAHNHNVSPQPETTLFAEFIYNKKGMVAKSIDYSSGTTTYYYYDFSGTATREYRQNSNESLSYHIGYDDDGNKVEKTAINGYVKTITTGTDEDGAFIDNDGVRISSKTDDFGRTTETVTKKDNLEFKTEYAYADGTSTNSTTNNVSSLTQKLGNSTLVTYEYEYDEDGNISEIYESNGNGNAVLSDEYYYDLLNELEIINDRKNGIYTHYTYDKAGNITEILKRNYDNNGVPSTLISQDTFEYEQNGWNDRLTKFNNDKISYDLNGNPLLYRDGMQFTWVNGRRLKTILYNGNTYAMSYDTNGMRTQKGNTHYYYDSGNNLVGMTDGTHTLLFYHDENGSPTSFTYSNSSSGTSYITYYYIKNLQGDIAKIVNSQGQTVASYAYDVSGKILSIKDYHNAVVIDPLHIGMLNPLRYRGYIYDDETGLYYLQSRYYDPVTTRFINADVFDFLSNTESVFNTNLFAYCNNNFCGIDTNGEYSDYFSSKTYNRRNAINYAAENFRNKKDSKMFRYLGDHRDCANFVSQCLYVGGIRMSNGWYYFLRPFGKDTYTYSWTVADDQYRYFKSWGFTRYVVKITKKVYDNKKRLKTLISNFEIKGGDLLYMDFNADNIIDHATMITGHSDRKELYYTAHSNPCYAKRVALAFDSHPKMIIKVIVLV